MSDYEILLLFVGFVVGFSARSALRSMAVGALIFVVAFLLVITFLVK